MRDLPSVSELRMRAFHSLRTIRQDHKRALNPTPYKVGEVSYVVNIQFLLLVTFTYFMILCILMSNLLSTLFNKLTLRFINSIIQL